MNKYILIAFATLTIPFSVMAGAKFPIDGSNGVIFTGTTQARGGFGKTRNSLSNTEVVSVIDRGSSMVFLFVSDDFYGRSCNTTDKRYMRIGRSANRNDELEIFLPPDGTPFGGVCSIVKNRKSTRYQLPEQ